MERVCSLECETNGRGEAVLFIHGAILSDTFAPLMREESLAGFRCIRYRRRGYGRSGPVTGEPTIEGHAQDALSVLEAVGERRAHVVAHSGGGPIAVQMAGSAPDVVRSLVLLEPALQNAAMAAAFDELLAPLVELYDSGERAKAVHLFMRTATSPGWRAQTEEHLPGAAARAEVDAAATFHGDLPALRRWDFDTVSSQISQPSLLMVGSVSEPRVRHVSAMFRAAVPASEFVVIEGADHSLQTTRPEAVAPVIAEFLHRHPFAHHDDQPDA
jgi:3-oxoadipate enol-lactonase